MMLAGERREWIKPIMFSGGLGTMEADQIKKNDPAKEMLVVKVGGPIYRIGVGGGAASSVEVQGNRRLANCGRQEGDSERLPFADCSQETK